MFEVLQCPEKHSGETLMSRSGYSDDYGGDFNNQMELYRNTVDQAIKGKRGQNFLRELLSALDAMPEKILIKGALEENGQVCALGAVFASRGKSVDGIDAYEPYQVAQALGIANCMAAEIAYENDEGAWERETPEERFKRVRSWVERRIVTREAAKQGKEGE